MTAAARRRTPRAGVRVVSSIDVLNGPRPRLVDFDEVDERLEVTAELPTYETLYRTVFEDLGGTRGVRE